MLAGQSAGGSFWQPLTSQVQKGFGDGLGLPFTGTGFTSQVWHICGKPQESWQWIW